MRPNRQSRLPAEYADIGVGFDRVMNLPARHDRKPPRVQRGFKPGGRRRKWTFEEAILLLDKKFRAMGVRTSGPVQGGYLRPLDK
jgi:hypothetical protein